MNNAMCSVCYYAMCNCHDSRICCESEEYYGEKCEQFEPINAEDDGSEE